SNLNPLALLNPKAYLGNEGSMPAPEIRTIPAQIQHESHGPVSLSQRLESLHTVKDRKVRAPPANEGIRRVSQATDRDVGNSLLSKSALSRSDRSLIDLTGTRGLLS